MATDMDVARSELGTTVALTTWRLEKALRTAASLSHGRDKASLSLRRLGPGRTEEAIDAIMLEKDAPERAVHALIRAAVVELVGRTGSLPPVVGGIAMQTTGHYVVRSSTRDSILFSFRLCTTRADLRRFQEEVAYERTQPTTSVDPVDPVGS